ncbi:MAG: YfhO family protein [Lachnospiraceae bacterium]|nr:YfhO family protein [Lachnospiraceae bacterium]
MGGAKKRTVVVLLLLELVICLIVFRQYIFGNKLLAFDDVGNDTKELYLSQYAAIARKIRNRDFSLWDRTSGFGVNMNMRNMTNPALVVVYVLGAVFGAEHIPAMMIWAYVAEILAAGLVMYLFLSMFSMTEKVRLLVAVMYAMNGFMTVWGEHYQFAIVPVLVPLELMLTERYLRDRRKWKGLVAMTFVLVANSMYIAYMTLLFAGVYVLARLLMRKWTGIRTFFQDLVRTAGTMLLGVGLAGVTLLPSVKAISEVSSRVSSNLSLVQRVTSPKYPWIYYRTLLGRLFSAQMLGISGDGYGGYLNFCEGPCLFFTTLFLFLGIQYLFLMPGMRWPVRKKVVGYGAYVCVLLCVLFPYAGVILNGFTAAFSRYFYLVMVCFAVFSAIALREILVRRRVSLVGIGLSLTLLVYAFYTYWGVGFVGNQSLLVLHFLAGILMAAALLVVRFGTKTGMRTAVIFLLLITCLDAGADTFVVFDASTEDMLTSRVALARDGAYMETMYDQDTRRALAAIEKDEGDNLVRTDKLYGATISMDGPAQGYMPVSTYNSTMNARLRQSLDRDWPELVSGDGNHLIYREGYVNRGASGLAGVRYILKEEGDLAVPGTEVWKTFGKVTVLIDPTVTSISTFYENGAYTKTADGADVTYDQRSKDASVEMHAGATSSEFKIHVENGRGGLLCTALPFEAGWRVYVDGRRVDPVPVNLGFTGVTLTSGAHTVQYVYHCPGLRTGCLISFAALLLVIMIALYQRRRRRRFFCPQV